MELLWNAVKNRRNQQARDIRWKSRARLDMLTHFFFRGGGEDVNIEKHLPLVQNNKNDEF